MSNLDWLVLFLTLVSIVIYGIYKTRGKKSLETYLKGNTANWWTIGLSIMATQASAITFLSTPGQAYEEANNGNKSQVHWDMVNIQRPEYGGGEIWFDGEMIRKDGEFVPEDLHKLNPDYLLQNS